MREKRVNDELIAAIYKDLKENHLGRENAVSRRDYSEGCGISEREMRVVTHEINQSVEYNGIVSTSTCLYMCGTKEECLKAIGTSYRTAFNLLRKAEKMKKKVEMSGQFSFDLKDMKLLVSYYFPPKKGDSDEADDLGTKKGD